MEAVNKVVNIGPRLKKLRQEKAFTQSQVAQLIGVTTAMISSYELGSRLPSYEKLIRLAKLYEVSTDYLLGRVEPRLPSVEQLTERQLALLSQIVQEFVREKE